MYYRRSHAKTARRKIPVLLVLTVLSILIVLALFFRRLSIQIAVSDAVDIVNSAVNDAVSEIISEGGYDFDYFVNLSKDESGNITAISSNMPHINALSTQILDRVMSAADDGSIDVAIPMGNLLGINLLTGSGPEINVDVVMLTSSKTDFKSVIQSAGINQNEYQLMLEITIDIDVMVPWATESATTVTEVLIADTVIVGSVPETYFKLEN
ncbi:MAG: sporulation protein YunB [Bacillota bacterium]|nr:sporulation protein YunB [Bacillota bacterium]